MTQLLIYKYRIPVRNVKCKRIYQFSDTHLTQWDDLSSEDEKQRAISRTEDWLRGRAGFAQAYGEPCGEAQMRPAKIIFEALLEASKEADALIMAGDIIDFDTDGNTRLLEQALKDYPIPYMPLCGNHDEPDKLPIGHPMKSAGEPVQKLDLGDMVILGFDNSKRVISTEQIEILKNTLQAGKPVLISMHIPIHTDGMAHNDDYYAMNYTGCPEENLLFMDIIQANADKVIAITCGHLHGAKVSEFCAGVNQYVSSQGLIGSLCVFDIGETEYEANSHTEKF